VATHDQQCFTVLYAAADWHELTVWQCIVQPSMAHDNGRFVHQKSYKHQGHFLQ